MSTSLVGNALLSFQCCFRLVRPALCGQDWVEGCEAVKFGVHLVRRFSGFYMNRLRSQSRARPSQVSEGSFTYPVHQGQNLILTGPVLRINSRLSLSTPPRFVPMPQRFTWESFDRPRCPKRQDARRHWVFGKSPAGSMPNMLENMKRRTQRRAKCQKRLA